MCPLQSLAQVRTLRVTIRIHKCQTGVIAGENDRSTMLFGLQEWQTTRFEAYEKCGQIGIMI